MKCPQCGVEVVDTSVYCHKCGERLDHGNGADLASDPPEPVAPGMDPGPGRDEPVVRPPADRLRGAVESTRGNGEPAEQELWRGGYSAKAMTGAWALGVLATVGLIVVCVIAWENPIVRWGVLAVAVLLWGYLVVVYARRRLGVYYRLTTQRFFHEKGILVHTTDLIEVIDMDDITYRQTIIDRMFGVGTIRIVSSDRSHPDLSVPGIDNVKDVAAKMQEARHNERMRRGLHIESI